MRFVLEYKVNDYSGMLTGTSVRVLQDFICVLQERLPDHHPLKKVDPPFTREQQRAIFREADAMMKVQYLVSGHRLH